MSESSAPPQGTERPARGPVAKTVRDMVLSMILVTAGAFILYFYLPSDDSKDPVRPVEYQVEANAAARAAPYDLLVPEGLPEEWRATSVRYLPQGDHGATWRLGFVNPDDEYAAVAQADGDAADFVEDLTHGARETGRTLRVDGREWEVYEGEKYDALVLPDAEVTTLVTGTASHEGLERLADALAVREDTAAAAD